MKRPHRNKLFFGDIVRIENGAVTHATLSRGPSSVTEESPVASTIFGMVIEACARYRRHYVVLVGKTLRSIHPSILHWVKRESYARAKIRYLFCNETLDMRASLRFDSVALYSVTDQITANRITTYILELPDIDSTSTITEATSCIGGNVVSFARAFHHVFAIEVHAKRFRMLQHNIAQLKLDNVTCVHQDYCKICKSIAQDIVFIDPPWGGRRYKQLETVDLALGSLDIPILCQMLLPCCKFIVLKVPMKFNVFHFRQHIDSFQWIKLTPKVGLIVVNNRACHPMVPGETFESTSTSTSATSGLSWVSVSAAAVSESTASSLPVSGTAELPLSTPAPSSSLLLARSSGVDEGEGETS